MRKFVGVIAFLLLSCGAGHAQVATAGSTSMSLPTVPGAIVTQPLNTPGPFSAATVSGMADTTLAPVPLASNPATPGTFVTCTTPSPLLVAGVPAPTVTATGAASSTSSSSTSSFTTAAGSTTGTISAATVGAAQATVCSDIPGGPATPPSVSLSLSTPQVQANPQPGVIAPDVSAGGDTSLDQASAMPVPTPNASSCTEGVSMSLSNPGTMAPANATGAAPTPGVTPADC
jgi:hypothetical protein